MAKHRIKAGTNTLELQIWGKPEKAGIDPYYKLIDLNPEDNIQNVKLERR